MIQKECRAVKAMECLILFYRKVWETDALSPTVTLVSIIQQLELLNSSTMLLTSLVIMSYLNYTRQSKEEVLAQSYNQHTKKFKFMAQYNLIKTYRNCT